MFVSMMLVQFQRKILGVPSFQLKTGRNVNGQASRGHLAVRSHQGSLLSVRQQQTSVGGAGAVTSVPCSLGGDGEESFNTEPP